MIATVITLLFRASLISVQQEYTKSNGAQNRAFFMHLGARKIVVHEILKYHFRVEFKGILLYFSPT